MLFRRISLHLHQQNWTAVFIDFIIVVVGVFVGIQVQTAYQDRSEQKLINGYLYKMHEEISASIRGTEATKQFVQTNLENLQIVTSSMAKCKLTKSNNNKFANGLFHAGKIIPAQFVDNTLQELRSSGRSLLLRNQALTNAITETLRVHKYLNRVWPSVQSRSGLYRDYIDSKIIYSLDGPINGLSQIEWRNIDIEFDALCQDREFRARLSGLERLTNINVDWLNRELNSFKSLRAELELALAD